jgi:hypothetical protein
MREFLKVLMRTLSSFEEEGLLLKDGRSDLQLEGFKVSSRNLKDLSQA